jgi:tRNA 2-thiouridine synthesizing protein A
MTTTILDLTGLKCPLPALLARKALLRLSPGQRLEVRCTDPMAVIDIPAMVQQLGDRIDSSDRSDERLVFIISKCDRMISDSD